MKTKCCYTFRCLSTGPELSDQRILEQLNKVQRANQIKPSDKLEGRASSYNLTIEMETGVGKTYTYIKTMFELNKIQPPLSTMI